MCDDYRRFEQLPADELMKECKDHKPVTTTSGLSVTLYYSGCFLVNGPDGVVHKYGERHVDKDGKVYYSPYIQDGTCDGFVFINGICGVTSDKPNAFAFVNGKTKVFDGRALSKALVADVVAGNLNEFGIPEWKNSWVDEHGVDLQ